MRVLVADDKEEGRYLLAAVLRAEGHDVVLAANGFDALARLSEDGDVDVIISDILMPKMDGFQLCREVKQSERLRRVPFIFYTALYTDPKDEELALALGASRYIVKPMDPPQFAEVIKEVVHETPPPFASDVPLGPNPGGLLTEYNERLVRTLQAKVQELEETSRRLQEALTVRDREFNTRQREDQATLQLAAIVEHSDDAIIAKDLDGVVTAWNRAAERIFGYSREEILGTPVTRLLPAWRADEAAGVSAAISRGERVAAFDTERLHKDGTLLSVSVTMSPIRDSNGRVFGASGILRDNSARKRAEQEREILLAKTQEAVRARDDFLSIASHELKTPTTALLLSAQQLRAAHTGGLAREEVVARIERQCRRLARLADELLDVARLRGGKMQVEREPVDLTALLGGVVRRLAEAAPTLPSKVTIDTEGPVVGSWDRARLEMVTSNLLSNALRFGQERPIELSLRARAGIATLEVVDHGIGIPPDRIDAIFAPFERAVSAREFGGLGLGLFIVRRSVEALGGTVRVSSELGAGSTFTVELPLNAPETASP